MYKVSQKESRTNSQSNGEWKIPLACPNCDGTLSLLGYTVQLKILKARYWHVCDNCGFDRNVEDFKKELFSV